MPYQATGKPKKVGNRLHVRTGDTVVVTAGKDKGKKGQVLISFPSRERVIVEGVNKIVKHQKPRGMQSPGGKIEREAAIHVSNVMLLCDKCGKPTRNAHKFTENGEKVRACKKCGATFDR